RLGDRLVMGEAGDPDAEQPDGAGWGVGAQEVEGDWSDHRGVVGRLVEGVGAGYVGPVVEADLDPDRPPGELARAQPTAELFRERDDVTGHLLSVGDIDVEGDL